jgi:hypothetical protein
MGRRWNGGNEKLVVKCPPAFANESAEADWWASKEGRAFLKRQPSGAAGKKGCAQVAELRRDICPKPGKSLQ